MSIKLPHIPSFTEKKYSCEKQMVTKLPGPNKMKVDKALDELVVSRGKLTIRPALTCQASKGTY